MKKYIFDFLKGILIGIANVIPGFSGGTMAVLLNVYDIFVYGFAHIFDKFLDVIKKCLALYLGVVAGLVLALFTITKLLEVIPFITVMFFIGLILGSLPEIFFKAKEGKLTVKDVISFLVSVAIIVILPLINNGFNASTYSILTFVILFFLGIICASAMVIPGVSGSLVLMAFGYYNFFMTSFKTWLANLFNFSMENYLNMFLCVVFFAVGVVIGLIFVSKLIEKLTEKYPKTVYFAIFGLLLASPFSMIYKSFCGTNPEYVFNATPINIIFGIIALVLSTAMVLLLNYYGKKKTEVK